MNKRWAAGSGEVWPGMLRLTAPGMRWAAVFRAERFSNMERIFLMVMAVAAMAAGVRAQPDGAVKWSFTTLSSTTPGAILSSPAIGADGTIYFGVQVGATKADAGGRVIALTPAGVVKWAATLPDWVDATPALGADGTVYVGCWDGKLHAFRPDGTKAWEYSAGGYIASSAAVGGDGTIYVGAGDFNVHAVNPDGTRKWVYPTADWVDGSPAVGVDGTVYVGAGRTFYAIGPDGIGQWQATLEGGVVGAAAIAKDGVVYVGARDRKVYAFAPSGTLLWFFATGNAVEASPTIGTDGTIYVGSLDGRLYALGRDGREKWRYPRGEAPAIGAIYSTAAVREDGVVVFGASDSHVHAVTADGLLAWTTPLGDWADASPAIAADGTIYIGSYDKRLYALRGASGPARSEWPMFRRDAARAGWQSLGLPRGGDGRLVNGSVRSELAPNGPPLTVGFSIAGDGERSLLVRGVGPALAGFGLADALEDPRLRVIGRGSGSLIADNQGWHRAPNVSRIAARAVEVGAFPLPNPSEDTAVLQDFRGGGYTVVIDSRGNRRGVVLTEIYDGGGADGGAARLSNLSAQAEARAGDGVLTAGFVVAGGRRTLLIRGVGPALGQFGVANALADPRLTIFDRGAEPALENDNWAAAPNATAAAAAMRAVGAFPLAPAERDAALLVEVEPGAYTVQVRGVEGAGGMALIEVYELP